MAETNLEQLKYPIGRFTRGLSYSFSETKENIKTFASFPQQLEALVKDWDDKTLSMSYREGGWNARQIINHLADSHSQLILRFKSTLTEENPEVRPYLENKWANLFDGMNSPIQPSIQIVTGVHGRLSFLFNSLSETDWQKTIYHPESKHTFTLAELLALYVWHGKQHYAHLKIIEQNK